MDGEDDEVQPTHLWCINSPEELALLLRQYCQDTEPKWAGPAEEYLCWCHECLHHYYEGKKILLEQAPENKEMLSSKEILRLRAWIEATLEQRQNDVPTDQLSIFLENSQFGNTAEQLQQPILEILQHPWLLFSKQLNGAFVKFVEFEYSSGTPIGCAADIPVTQMPGIFMLLIHPNKMVRNWASGMLHRIHPITRENYDDIGHIITLMLSPVEFGLFDNLDVEMWDTMGSDMLPRDLVCIQEQQAYWKGIVQVLKCLNDEATKARLMGPPPHGHRTIADAVVNVVIESRQADTEEDNSWKTSVFWPALECLEVLLSKLKCSLWQYISKAPDQILKDITAHPVFEKAVSGEQKSDFAAGSLARSSVLNIIATPASLSSSVVNAEEPFTWLRTFVHSFLDVGDLAHKYINHVIMFLVYRAECGLDPDNTYFDNDGCPSVDALERKTQAASMVEKVMITLLDIMESLLQMELYEVLIGSVHGWPHAFVLYLIQQQTPGTPTSRSMHKTKDRCLNIVAELLRRGLKLNHANKDYTEFLQRMDAHRYSISGSRRHSRERRPSGDGCPLDGQEDRERFVRAIAEIVTDLKLKKDQKEQITNAAVMAHSSRQTNQRKTCGKMPQNECDQGSRKSKASSSGKHKNSTQSGPKSKKSKKLKNQKKKEKESELLKSTDTGSKNEKCLELNAAKENINTSPMQIDHSDDSTRTDHCTEQITKESDLPRMHQEAADARPEPEDSRLCISNSSQGILSKEVLPLASVSDKEAIILETTSGSNPSQSILSNGMPPLACLGQDRGAFIPESTNIGLNDAQLSMHTQAKKVHPTSLEEDASKIEETKDGSEEPVSRKAQKVLVSVEQNGADDVQDGVDDVQNGVDHVQGGDLSIDIRQVDIQSASISTDEAKPMAVEGDKDEVPMDTDETDSDEDDNVDEVILLSDVEENPPSEGSKLIKQENLSNEAVTMPTASSCNVSLEEADQKKQQQWVTDDDWKMPRTIPPSSFDADSPCKTECEDGSGVVDGRDVESPDLFMNTQPFHPVINEDEVANEDEVTGAIPPSGPFPDDVVGTQPFESHSDLAEGPSEMEDCEFTRDPEIDVNGDPCVGDYIDLREWPDFHQYVTEENTDQQESEFQIKQEQGQDEIKCEIKQEEDQDEVKFEIKQEDQDEIKFDIKLEESLDESESEIKQEDDQDESEMEIKLEEGMDENESEIKQEEDQNEGEKEIQLEEGLDEVESEIKQEKDQDESEIKGKEHSEPKSAKIDGIEEDLKDIPLSPQVSSSPEPLSPLLSEDHESPIPCARRKQRRLFEDSDDDSDEDNAIKKRERRGKSLGRHRVKNSYFNNKASDLSVTNKLGQQELQDIARELQELQQDAKKSVDDRKSKISDDDEEEEEEDASKQEKLQNTRNVFEQDFQNNKTRPKVSKKSSLRRRKVDARGGEKDGISSSGSEADSSSDSESILSPPYSQTQKIKPVKRDFSFSIHKKKKRSAESDSDHSDSILSQKQTNSGAIVISSDDDTSDSPREERVQIGKKKLVEFRERLKAKRLAKLKDKKGNQAADGNAPTTDSAAGKDEATLKKIKKQPDLNDREKNIASSGTLNHKVVESDSSVEEQQKNLSKTNKLFKSEDKEKHEPVKIVCSDSPTKEDKEKLRRIINDEEEIKQTSVDSICTISDSDSSNEEPQMSHRMFDATESKPQINTTKENKDFSKTKDVKPFSKNVDSISDNLFDPFKEEASVEILHRPDSSPPLFVLNDEDDFPQNSCDLIDEDVLSQLPAEMIVISSDDDDIDLEEHDIAQQLDFPVIKSEREIWETEDALNAAGDCDSKVEVTKTEHSVHKAFKSEMLEMDDSSVSGEDQGTSQKKVAKIGDLLRAVVKMEEQVDREVEDKVKVEPTDEEQPHQAVAEIASTKKEPDLTVTDVKMEKKPDIDLPQSIYSDITSDDEFDTLLEQGHESLSSISEPRHPEKSNDDENQQSERTISKKSSADQEPVVADTDGKMDVDADENVDNTCAEGDNTLHQGEADDDNTIVDYNAALGMPSDFEQDDGDLDFSAIGEADDDNAIINYDSRTPSPGPVEGQVERERPLSTSSFYHDGRESQMSKSDLLAGERYLETVADKVERSPSSLPRKSLWSPPAKPSQHNKSAGSDINSIQPNHQIPQQQSEKPRARAPVKSCASRLTSRLGGLLETMKGKESSGVPSSKPAGPQVKPKASDSGQPLGEVNRQVQSQKASEDGAHPAERTPHPAKRAPHSDYSKSVSASTTLSVGEESLPRGKENEPSAANLNRPEPVVARPVSFAAATVKPNKELTRKNLLEWVLSWECDWLTQGKDFCYISGILAACRYKRHVRVPLDFKSMDRYYEVFIPQLLVETWAKLRKDYDEVANPSMDCVMYRTLNTEATHSGYMMTCQVQVPIPRDKEGDPKFNLSEEDFLIVSPHPDANPVWGKMFAVVLQVVTKNIPKTGQQSYISSPREIIPEEEPRKFLDVMLLTLIKDENFNGHCGQQFMLQVMGSLVTTTRQFHAVTSLYKNVLARDVLRFRRMDVFCHDNSRRQRLESAVPCSSEEVRDAAVKAICEPDTLPRIFLLQGPPGTGKTYTIINIITKLLQVQSASASNMAKPSPLNPSTSHPKILLCAPSNAAVDVVVCRLVDALMRLERTGISRPEGKKSHHNAGHYSVIRLGRREVHPNARKYSLEDVVERTLERNRHDDQEKINDELDRGLWELDNKIREVERNIDQLTLSDKREELRTAQRNRDNLYNQRRNLEDQKARNRQSGGQRVNCDINRIRQKVLTRADVICCTLNSAGNQMFQSHIYYQQANNRKQVIRFSCVIVDEATQCTEPDCLVPLQYGTSKLVLVGDPQQLPATVISQDAAKMKYNQSLFERYYRFFQVNHEFFPHNPVRMLKMQFRMHAEICRFPSQQFYEGQVETHREVAKQRDLFFLCPYLLFDVADGREHRYAPGWHLLQNARTDRSMEPPAIINTEETGLLLELYNYIQYEFSRRQQGIPLSIGIITPYQTQRRYLAREFQKLPNVEITTVDSFQGREKDVIILSCVRTNGETQGIGFVADPKRMNVALTRARYALYVVGHLKSLYTNTDWRSLIDDGVKRRLIVRARRGDYKRVVINCRKRRRSLGNNNNSGCNDSMLLNETPIQPVEGHDITTPPEKDTTPSDREMDSNTSNKRHVLSVANNAGVSKDGRSGSSASVKERHILSGKNNEGRSRNDVSRNTSSSSHEELKSSSEKGSSGRSTNENESHALSSKTKEISKDSKSRSASQSGHEEKKRSSSDKESSTSNDKRQVLNERIRNDTKSDVSSRSRNEEKKRSSGSRPKSGDQNHSDQKRPCTSGDRRSNISKGKKSDSREKEKPNKENADRTGNSRPKNVLTGEHSKNSNPPKQQLNREERHKIASQTKEASVTSNKERISTGIKDRNRAPSGEQNGRNSKLGNASKSSHSKQERLHRSGDKESNTSKEKRVKDKNEKSGPGKDHVDQTQTKNVPANPSKQLLHRAASVKDQRRSSLDVEKLNLTKNNADKPRRKSFEGDFTKPRHNEKTGAGTSSSSSRSGAVSSVEKTAELQKATSEVKKDLKAGRPVMTSTPERKHDGEWKRTSRPKLMVSPDARRKLTKGIQRVSSMSESDSEREWGAESPDKIRPLHSSSTQKESDRSQGCDSTGNSRNIFSISPLRDVARGSGEVKKTARKSLKYPSSSSTQVRKGFEQGHGNRGRLHGTRDQSRSSTTSNLGASSVAEPGFVSPSRNKAKRGRAWSPGAGLKRQDSLSRNQERGSSSYQKTYSHPVQSDQRELSSANADPDQDDDIPLSQNSLLQKVIQKVKSKNSNQPLAKMVEADPKPRRRGSRDNCTDQDANNQGVVEQDQREEGSVSKEASDNLQDPGLHNTSGDAEDQPEVSAKRKKKTHKDGDSSGEKRRKKRKASDPRKNLSTVLNRKTPLPSKSSSIGNIDYQSVPNAKKRIAHKRKAPSGRLEGDDGEPMKKRNHKQGQPARQPSTSLGNFEHSSVGMASEARECANARGKSSSHSQANPNQAGQPVAAKTNYSHKTPARTQIHLPDNNQPHLPRIQQQANSIERGQTPVKSCLRKPNQQSRGVSVRFHKDTRDNTPASLKKSKEYQFYGWPPPKR